jgi:hypothetical protein
LPLTSAQQNTISKFLREQDLPRLYQKYEWPRRTRIRDTWQTGFPELFRLEKEISQAARENSLNRNHLIQIAQWGGGARMKDRISWPNPTKTRLYINNKPADWLKKAPEKTVEILDREIDYFGPTYCSKLLHFALPQIFGALDTRLVQTFGKAAKQYPILDLEIIRSGWGPSIRISKSVWPKEFGIWISALNCISQILNQEEIKCPHPKRYEQFGLRGNGLWLPADVETALFSYTYLELGDACKHKRNT